MSSFAFQQNIFIYSDLSSNVKVFKYFKHTEGEKPHWFGNPGGAYGIFLREIGNSAGQNLGQRSSLIPLIIIINIKKWGNMESPPGFFHLKETKGMRCKSGLLSNE